MSPAPLLETAPHGRGPLTNYRATIAADARHAPFLFPVDKNLQADPRLLRIVNDVVQFRDQPDYLISLSRVATAPQILGCVSHLTTKSWATPETIRAFIATTCEHHGIRIVETA